MTSPYRQTDPASADRSRHQTAAALWVLAATATLPALGQLVPAVIAVCAVRPEAIVPLAAYRSLAEWIGAFAFALVMLAIGRAPQSTEARRPATMASALLLGGCGVSAGLFALAYWEARQLSVHPAAHVFHRFHGLGMLPLALRLAGTLYAIVAVDRIARWGSLGLRPWLLGSIALLKSAPGAASILLYVGATNDSLRSIRLAAVLSVCAEAIASMLIAVACIRAARAVTGRVAPDGAIPRDRRADAGSMSAGFVFIGGP